MPFKKNWTKPAIRHLDQGTSGEVTPKQKQTAAELKRKSRKAVDANG